MTEKEIDRQLAILLNYEYEQSMIGAGGFYRNKLTSHIVQGHLYKNDTIHRMCLHWVLRHHHSLIMDSRLIFYVRDFNRSIDSADKDPFRAVALAYLRGNEK